MKHLDTISKRILVSGVVAVAVISSLTLLFWTVNSAHANPSANTIDVNTELFQETRPFENIAIHGEHAYYVQKSNGKWIFRKIPLRIAQEDTDWN